MFGLVWLRFGLAKFGLAMFGSQINGIGHTDACMQNFSSIGFDLAELYLILCLVWLRFDLAKFGLAMFCSQINGIGHTDAACKISAQSDLIWLSYSFP